MCSEKELMMIMKGKTQQNVMYGKLVQRLRLPVVRIRGLVGVSSLSGNGRARGNSDEGIIPLPLFVGSPASTTLCLL